MFFPCKTTLRYHWNGANTFAMNADYCFAYTRCGNADSNCPALLDVKPSVTYIITVKYVKFGIKIRCIRHCVSDDSFWRWRDFLSKLVRSVVLIEWIINWQWTRTVKIMRYISTVNSAKFYSIPRSHRKCSTIAIPDWRKVDFFGYSERINWFENHS